MKLTSLLPLALLFAAASAHPKPKPKLVACSGPGSISAAADEHGKYYQICECPEGTEQTLLYTVAGPPGGYFCAPVESIEEPTTAEEPKDHGH
ncbi:hypothetical protein BJY04DRAFT_222891 [Aspergillus karnatakaensis]|uniref:uncharacterized protein n=1 Tax=Aspergillus karnatakaensis TaxID=1810916 RepID=UPI003CCD7E1F